MKKVKGVAPCNRDVCSCKHKKSMLLVEWKPSLSNVGVIDTKQKNKITAVHHIATEKKTLIFHKDSWECASILLSDFKFCSPIEKRATALLSSIKGNDNL